MKALLKLLKHVKRIKYLNCKCDPLIACARHGRCWTHSEWADPSERRK